MEKAKVKIKKSTIVLVLSSLILITLIVIYFVTRPVPERPVSPREQYQQQLNQGD
ncbi:MAG: hypothetical protein ILP10_02595 [Lachnospiraceae bacterium]|nr:hypothetical protein [Lachnospiraceae bacterium]